MSHSPTISSTQKVDQLDPGAYGAAFRSIYDLVFPMDASARWAAQFLFDLAPAERRQFAEYGVGTGRVALPLAQLGAAVQGVDISHDLLTVARQKSEASNTVVDLQLGDLRTWLPSRPVAVAYCVCATLSMVQTIGDVELALTTMSKAVGPHGRVVIETHHPLAVQAVHAAASTVPLRLAVPGVVGGLNMRSALDEGVWTLEHRWAQDGIEHRAVERSLVLSPAELSVVAARVGLRVSAEHSSWRKDAPDPSRPTIITVLAQQTDVHSALQPREGR